MKLSICSYVAEMDDEKLTGFFRQLLDFERTSNINLENLSLVDERCKSNVPGIYSNSERVHFENASQVRNSLIEMAKGDWILHAEPTMVYDINNLVYVVQVALSSGFKCVEAWQNIVHPDGETVMNLQYTLTQRGIPFHGLAFEAPRVFPHQATRADVLVGNNFMDSYESRMEKAKPLITKELDELACVPQEPAELFWAAERYAAIFLMEQLSAHDADRRILPLYKKAISLKPDFGPAYFELARYNFTRDRYREGLDAARAGWDNSHYGPCMNLLKRFLQ
jgi:hypothetical protein